MKKWLIAALLILLAVLIAVSVFLIVRFVSLSGADQTDGAEQSAQSTELPDAAGKTGIEAYVNKHWSGYEASYDPTADVLTLSQSTQMRYDDACAYGGSVYKDELAPATYQQNAAIIAIDVAEHCDCPSLSVTLCYLSTDGKPIFTVGSDGDIWTCWDTNKP